MLNLGLVFETLLAVVLCYVPGMEYALRMQPLKFQWWLLAMPYFIWIFLYDEARKWCVRRWPQGFLAMETTY